MKTCEKCKIPLESGELCETCTAEVPVLDKEELEHGEPGIIDVEFVEVEAETREAESPEEGQSGEDEVIDAEGTGTNTEDAGMKAEDAEEAEEEKQEEAAELSKKEERRLRKERERQNREDKKKAKEELRRIKKEKKANRKFKKLRRTLKALAILIVLFLGGTLWYLGHSEILPEYDEDGKGGEKILEIISEDQSEDGRVLLPYRNFNEIIRRNFDPLTVDAISMATVESAFYSEKEERFVFTLKHLLGKTSLLFEARANYDGERLRLELSKPRLGSWKLPILSPTLLKRRESELPFPQIGWLKIRDIGFEKEGLRIIYDFDSERIDEEFRELRRELDPQKAAYLSASEIEFPASDLIFERLFDEKKGEGRKEQKAIFTEEELRSILAEFLKHPEEIVNWTMLTSGDAEDSFIEISKVIYGKEKTEEALLQMRKKEKGLDRDFDSFMTEKIEAKLTEAAKAAFEAIRAVHKKAGLPAYYYADGGRLYSQTMQKYLKLEDLGISPEEDFAPELYAAADKAILAIELDDEMLYVSEGGKKVKKEGKNAFLKKIRYKDEKKLPRIRKPSLDVHEAIPFANAILSKEGYGSQDLLELRYLAHTDKHAIAIGALKNKPENAPKYYLLDAKDGAWRVIDIFSEQKKLGSELLEEIASGAISPRLLPETEMADFQRESLSAHELRELMKRFPEYTELSYHTIVDGNLYIEVKEDAGKIGEFLLTDGINGQMEAIRSGKDRAEAIRTLKGKVEYPEYKPQFMFRQINSVFVK